MALAAPTRRSASGAAAAPAAPPEPKKRPRDRPRPGGKARSAATAPATPKKGKADSPIRKTKGARATKPSASVRAAATAPARKSPVRKTTPKRRTGARVIPIAAGTAGRAAVAMTQLPESGLIHRLTRGRAWIGVLGVLLVGIVALNVVTLSFAASAGKVGERNAELSKENSVLQSRAARESGQGKTLHEAAKMGLSMQAKTAPQVLRAEKGDVATAAARLAAIAGAGAATSTAAGEEGASAAGEEAASGEESATGEVASAEGEATADEALSAEELATAEAEGISPEQAALNKQYEETLAAEATG
jgi:hypothetical protein